MPKFQSPSRMFCAVVTTACSADEHSRLTVIATDSIGSPAWIAATDIGEVRISRDAVADRHVVDLLRVDARALHGLFHHRTGKFVRLKVR